MTLSKTRKKTYSNLVYSGNPIMNKFFKIMDRQEGQSHEI